MTAPRFNHLCVKLSRLNRHEFELTAAALRLSPQLRQRLWLAIHSSKY